MYPLRIRIAIVEQNCRVIMTKVMVVKVMHEFILREIHQTHTGQWSLVN